jgi:biotin carboxyl carrier protein
MSRTMIAALTLAAIAACGRGDKSDTAAADSLNRDLQLAPVDTTAELNDRPSDTAMASAPAPAARTPTRPSRPAASASAPAPKPSVPAATPAPARIPPAAASASLAAGTRLSAATTGEVRSNKNKVGDTVTATIANDVKDNAGHVVIPAGSEVVLKVTAIKESENKSDKTGTLTLQPTSVSINGQSYPLSARIDSVGTELQGRKTGAGDIAKVGAGAGIGAVVGRVLGGSTKGAVIGGVIGGAVGAQRAVETKDRDVVVPEGTTVVLVLDESFKKPS